MSVIKERDGQDNNRIVLISSQPGEKDKVDDFQGDRELICCQLCIGAARGATCLSLTGQTFDSRIRSVPTWLTFDDALHETI